MKISAELEPAALQHNQELWVSAKFREGDRVRVTDGVAPTGYPNGGWAVKSIHPLRRDKVSYLLEHTRANYGVISVFEQDVADDTPTFGRRVSQLRKDGGLKQRELAEMLNYTPTVISQWETGSTSANGPALVALAELFNCTVDYLLGLSDEKSRK